VKIKVELPMHDEITVTVESDQYSVQAIGCSKTLDILKKLKSQHGSNPSQWPMPCGNHHSEILVRELILRTQQQFDFPYQHHEICHCRAVPTEKVDQAIVQGAHTPEAVSRLTSASTACGSCKPDVEKILSFRLNLVGKLPRR
jgi:bacterioferritin-associated ferredoxin